MKVNCSGRLVNTTLTEQGAEPDPAVTHSDALWLKDEKILSSHLVQSSREQRVLDPWDHMTWPVHMPLCVPRYMLRSLFVFNMRDLLITPASVMPAAAGGSAS
ncbi:hypothetical protein R1flu_005381 [Riccia fluitans]|uniref:Transport inhibitor response 1 n=1 Tax=Riccia fluitans TaxID=41844 RepID=A0ABD1YT21_9MARC